MQLKYFDSTMGVERYKRRYVWSFWAYLAGVVTGAILLSLLRSW